MCSFSEKRSITYRDNDVYCRYLSVGLTKWPPSAIKLGGKFGDYLNELGIKSLPFRIHLPDLLCFGVLQSSLYVELPRSFFDQWHNFPEKPIQSEERVQTDAGWYSLEILPHLFDSFDDCIHPYDGSLKEQFSDRFKSQVPKVFSWHEHRNGSKFVAAEAYIPYWQAYVLGATYHKYQYMEYHVLADEGKQRYLELLKNDVCGFIEKYQGTFERVSWYKTIVNAAQPSSIQFTQGQIFSLVQQHSQANLTVLKEDLHLLLALDYSWTERLRRNGCTVLQNVNESLRQDIYWIYEQLRLCGCEKKALLDEFQAKNCSAETALDEVLENEWYRFQRAFCDFGSHYCSEISTWDYTCTESEFARLYQIAGFDSWMRAFYDMHQALQNMLRKSVTFKQERIVDGLIVLAVRTEIVLREMLRPVLQSKSDESIKGFLNKASCHLSQDTKIVLQTCCNQIAEVTKLYDKPTDIFARIDQECPKNWSSEHIHFLQAILKFITARNYFAHHAYKDADLNSPTSKLAEHILKSLIATLLFFDRHVVSKTESGVHQ